jgi:PII-like signaling protein
MLQPGRAKKVTIHLNEDTAAKLDFLYNEIFSFLFQRGVAGATVSRPVAGFGSHHRMHGSDLGAGSGGHLPVRIEFIESVERVDGLMPDLCELLTDGLIEAHETTVYKAAAKRDHPV